VFIKGGDIPTTIERARLVLVERAESAEAENARLRAAITSLLVRVRPNSEAAAWVVDELRAALAPTAPTGETR
jgi:hypothetical protein